MKICEEFYSRRICRLVKALLIYSNGGEYFCTVNRVVQRNENFHIQEGVAVNGKNLAELLEMLGKNPAKDFKTLQWVNPRILAEGPGSVLWYTPAKRREIFFSCRNSKLMKISGKEFPFPALLFHARKNQLCVYVLGSSRRPTVETVLYQAPFWNVSANGTVCLPTHARDKSHTPEEWEDIFFKSAFSHAGSAAFKEGSVESLFPKLVGDPKSLFPVKNCFRHKFKVGDLLERKKSK